MDEIYPLKNGHILIVKRDNEPSNPRTWDNIGKMVCFHREYALGDDHDYKKDNFDSWDELEERLIENEEALVILPLYLFDHSGITMSTRQFSCPWDSGQVGFIYASKDAIMEEYGVPEIDDKLRERVESILNSEVEDYDRYLTGDVWYWQEKTPDGEEIDACYCYCDKKEILSEFKDDIVPITRGE